MMFFLREVFREWRRWRRRRQAERERRRRTLADYDRVISPVVWLDAEDELEAYLDHRFGAAIARLETAASTWFNQELHRDLQSLIAAARAADRSEPLRSTVVDPPKSADDPRLDEKAREEKPDDIIWTWVSVPNSVGCPPAFVGSIKHRRDLADVAEPYRQAIIDARARYNKDV